MTSETKPPAGIVAAGHAVTADAAVAMLHAGGNAFDAALAGVMAACVAEPALASLGGGGFLMAYDAAADRTVAYDFFPDTPRHKRPRSELDFHGAQADFGPATQEFYIGAGAAAVPSVVPGLFAIHADLCLLPLSTLIEPAVSAAREGIEVTPFQHYLFTVISSILTASAEARALFAPDGGVLTAGALFLNPALADTLEAITRDGPALFATGAGAEAVLAQMEHGGHLTADDLACYRVAVRKPLDINYRDATIALNPPPSAGGALIAFGLAMLERLGGAPDITTIARVMAATNDARAMQREALDGLLDRAHVERQVEAIGSGPQVARGTTHLSIIDAGGNAAALTLSNGEGNGLMVGGFGFMLNNMLGEEDLSPDGFHAWPEGVRLSSMMSPTLIRRGDGSMTALGSGGSNRIRTAILQVAVNLIDRGMPLAEAVDAARLHVEKSGRLSFEDLFPEGARAELLRFDAHAHAWPERNLFFGGVHSVTRKADGTFDGAGDPRRRSVVRVA